MSATRSAPCAWQSLPSPSSGWWAPVEVSAWTIPTAFTFSFFSASSMRPRSQVSPRDLDLDELRPAAADDVGHAVASYARRHDDDGVARLDDVHERRLHAGGTRAGDRDREQVLRAEGGSELPLHLVHDDLGELRVEVAEQRRRHGAQHARG